MRLLDEDDGAAPARRAFPYDAHAKHVVHRRFDDVVIAFVQVLRRGVDRLVTAYIDGDGLALHRWAPLDALAESTVVPGSQNPFASSLEGQHVFRFARCSSAFGDNANQFVFKVKKDATRPEIKAAVEKIYGVEVAGVTVANVKGKVKRTMRGLSRKPSWKKAYVRVADGQEIDFTAEAK